MTKIVVCASGEGSNFEAIVQASRMGNLKAEVTGLITNKDGVGATLRAQKLGVHSQAITLKAFKDFAQWDGAMLDQLLLWRADWVVLAGFLALVGPKTLQRFSGHIVNSHPALLPRHGGKGMYGLAVHEAVVAAKDLETGVTIHLVDSHYDQGRILAQQKIPVYPAESAQSLEARVKAIELSFYPKVLNDLVNGSIT